MRCCCGKKDIEEPVFVNDYVHEPYGPEGNFCGPMHSHEIRDLLAEVEQLRTDIKYVHKAFTHRTVGRPVVAELLRRLAEGTLRDVVTELNREDSCAD